jgi:hypothetical protein
MEAGSGQFRKSLGNITLFRHLKNVRETAAHHREGSKGTAFVAEQSDGGSVWLSPAR